MTTGSRISQPGKTWLHLTKPCPGKAEAPGLSCASGTYSGDGSYGQKHSSSRSAQEISYGF